MKPSLYTHVRLCLAAFGHLVVGGAAGRRSFVRTLRSVRRNMSRG